MLQIQLGCQLGKPNSRGTEVFNHKVRQPRLFSTGCFIETLPLSLNLRDSFAVQKSLHSVFGACISVTAKEVRKVQQPSAPTSILILSTNCLIWESRSTAVSTSLISFLYWELSIGILDRGALLVFHRRETIFHHYYSPWSGQLLRKETGTFHRVGFHLQNALVALFISILFGSQIPPHSGCLFERSLSSLFYIPEQLVLSHHLVGQITLLRLPFRWTTRRHYFRNIIPVPIFISTRTSSRTKT